MGLYKSIYGTIISALFLISCQNQEKTDSIPPESPYFNNQWANNKLWDDGLAEVAIYEATRNIYGKSRSFDYVYVAVKEVFNEEFQVKTDDYNREDLFDVIKVNKFADIPTENYPYHFLTSVFFKRQQPHAVHKLTNSSQEWCGLTTKSFLSNSQGYKYEWISYWDGQGNGASKVASAMFEDQLSYSLRALKFEEGLSFDIDIYPSQVTSKASPMEMKKASITIQKDQLVDSVMQSYNQVWRVNLTYKETGNQIKYWFSGDYPNYLLQMEAWDGRKLKLKELSRYAYWGNRN